MDFCLYDKSLISLLTEAMSWYHYQYDWLTTATLSLHWSIWLCYPEIMNTKLQSQGQLLQVKVGQLRVECWEVSDDKIFDGNISSDDIFPDKLVCNLVSNKSLLLNVRDVKVWHIKGVERRNSKLRDSIRHHLLQEFQDLLQEVIHRVPDRLLLGHTNQKSQGKN